MVPHTGGLKGRGPTPNLNANCLIPSISHFSGGCPPPSPWERHKDPPRPGSPAGAGPPTQMSSWARTTLPFRQARCSAVRPSASPQVSFTSSREPCASSRMTVRRSSSAVARSRCWPRDSSVQGSGARKSFCSYLARIHRSFSSLQEPADGRGHNPGGEDGGDPSALPPARVVCAQEATRGEGTEETGVLTGTRKPPRKACPAAYKVIPIWSTTWAPVRDADSQAPSQPRPPPEPLEGSVFTSPAGDSDTLRCESQGSG